MTEKTKFRKQDVAAIVTAMTEGERPFLHETMEAVLTDEGIGQVILCLNKQNDWIEEVLGELLKDPRLETVKIQFAPLPSVRNQALDYVKLPWIAYCDGDDVWCQGKTQRQRAYAEATNSAFVGVDHLLTDEQGKVRAVAQSRHIPMPSSWMVQTEIMKKYMFDDSVTMAEDGEWWVRTRETVEKVRYCYPLIKYRVRSGSMSSMTPSKRKKTKIISLSNKPVVGKAIYLASWLAWFLHRRSHYIWLKAWKVSKAEI